MKLNQLIAILQTTKSQFTKAITGIHHQSEKPALFQGQSRTFQPREEDGYVYPAESQKLMLTADPLLKEFADACTEFYNLTATQDWANTEAKASVVVDGTTIVADAPVTYLLFLEDRLLEVKKFVQSLPVLSIDKDWHYDAGRGCYVTDPRATTKTKKIVEFVVAYPATPEHPAQIKEVSKDVIEGEWSLVEFSGALSKDRIKVLSDRVDKLHKAVIQARQEANGMNVTLRSVSGSIFGYLFA